MQARAGNSKCGARSCQHCAFVMAAIAHLQKIGRSNPLFRFRRSAGCGTVVPLAAPCLSFSFVFPIRPCPCLWAFQATFTKPDRAAAQSIQSQISQITSPLMAGGGTSGSGSDPPSDDAVSLQCARMRPITRTRP